MNKNVITYSILISLVSCASTFPYRWYGIDPDKQILLGKTPQEDLPLSTCSPDQKSKGKCAVFLIEDFERMRNDHIILKEKVKELEKKCETSGWM